MAFYLIWFEFVAYIELCGFSIEIEIENCGGNKQEFGKRSLQSANLCVKCSTFLQLFSTVANLKN